MHQQKLKIQTMVQDKKQQKIDKESEELGNQMKNKERKQSEDVDNEGAMTYEKL